MSMRDDIRQRAQSGIATLADVWHLLGELETMEQKPPEIVYVPDNEGVARKVQADKDAAIAREAAQMQAGAAAGKGAELAAARDQLAANLRQQAGL